ncbi:MAG TPA: type II toxin-antitoxin system RelE/ParE family toxin [Nitrospinota bacterium]|nr:type II toxin-antitoxin system RelE/ParE family toxin [Nitrospinota bacterium]
MKIIASNLFLKFKKKTSKKLQLEIDNQIKKIVNNPEIGEIKKGDLTGIRIHKFNTGSQLLLLSYEYIKDVLYLYTIGSHENFYKKLKRFL